MPGMSQFDVIVIGVGGVGSAACYELSKRGLKVLGLERFRVGHDRGSSHGQTRMIRLAYFEHPSYVPLLRVSFEKWKELEKEFKQKLFHQVGLVLYGDSEKSSVLSGVERSSDQYSIAIESLDAAEAQKRFEWFRCPENFRAVYEKGAGFLEVENCVHAFAELAQASGAVIHDGEAVVSWEPKSTTSVEVTTAQNTYRAQSLVIAGGAWSGQLLQSLKLPLTVHRNLLYWFEAPDEFSLDKNTPCFGFDTESGFFYGFPKVSAEGIKLASHVPGNVLEDPNQLHEISQDSLFSPLLVEPISRFVSSALPGVSTSPNKVVPCMYTMTPDENFVLDQHPDSPNVFFAAGLSGHGFKMAPALGAVLADRAVGETSPLDLEFLRCDRFEGR